ncbi:MAG: hypothetical protein LKK21_01335 [Prevotella sp.]|jgi:hypothetical protein|nr:hypothetical protein [Prevotella sp.]MCH3985187.1 hypothetical protein [Prevotella sp.]MCH3992047.1 hypothetical protein [Prevotella sp.]MCH4017380.1 hypothetical protein [Prevotella sp.]MCH4185317.1 hypothetical protein [Prevotella sp.]MCI1290868.1 hypothetical protein [Prevotella sp.]
MKDLFSMDANEFDDCLSDESMDRLHGASKISGGIDNIKIGIKSVSVGGHINI